MVRSSSQSWGMVDVERPTGVARRKMESSERSKNSGEVGKEGRVVGESGMMEGRGRTLYYYYYYSYC